MTLIAPVGLLALAFALPILALYLLRLRRREVVVSSHFLWQKSVQDLSANTPFQRLRRHALLFLQLLIVGVLAVALGRLAWVSSVPLGGHVVLLLDASVSMHARDEAGGRTRFEQAQRLAQDVLQRLEVTDSVTVILVASTATVLAENAPVSAVAPLLASAQAGYGGADWDTAFTLALAHTTTRTRVLLMSDSDTPSAYLPATFPPLEVLAVGQTASNLALTAFAIRTENAQAQLFAELFNASEAPATGTLTLRRDGVLWQAQSFAVAGRARTRLVIPLEGNANVIQGRIQADAPFSDVLAWDDTAWAIAPAPSEKRVLLVADEGERFVTSALSGLPNVQIFRASPDRSTLPAGSFDAVVLVNALPDSLPATNTLFINPPRSSALFTLGEETLATQNPRTVQPTHPINNLVAWDAVTVRALRAISTASAQPLVMLGDVPFVLAGERDGQRVVIVPFALTDTDLPLQIAFPIFIANALAWLTPDAPLTERTSYVTNESVPLRLPLVATHARVTAPDGTRYTLARGSAFPFTGTLGVYYVEALAQDERVLLSQAFAVNVLDARESDLTPRTFAPATTTQAHTTDAPTTITYELWGALLLLAFFLLLLEWWLYHRQWRTLRR